MPVDRSIMTSHISELILCSKYARTDDLIPYSMRGVRPGSCWNRREAWSTVCAIVLLYGIGYIVGEENQADPKREGRSWFRDGWEFSCTAVLLLLVHTFSVLSLQLKKLL